MQTRCAIHHETHLEPKYNYHIPFKFRKLSNLSQIVFTDETSVSARTQLSVSEPAVRTVVLACRHITDILLKVMVNLLEPGNIIDDREKPSGPIQLIRVFTFEELPVEKRNKGFHCLFRRLSFKRTPPIEGTCFSADLPFHLLNRGISQANPVSLALVSQKIKGFSRSIYPFLIEVGLEPVFLQKGIELSNMMLKALLVGSKQYYIIRITGIGHIFIEKK